MNSTISSGDKPYRLMSPETIKHSGSFKIAEKLKDYMLLVKFNLSFMVVFSAVISYLLAPMVKVYDWKAIMLLFIGGMLVTGSANAINQAMEKQTDAMMKRTADRLFGEDYQWSVLGVGRNQIPLATISAAMGSNVRVGLEDNVYYSRGRKAKSNAELVQRSVRIAHELNRAIATPSQARAMLGLSSQPSKY